MNEPQGAGVSEPSLTDEELAEWMRLCEATGCTCHEPPWPPYMYGRSVTHPEGCATRLGVYAKPIIVRLIAALRASRAEVEYYTNAADLATAEAARLGAANAALRQEIAVLTARLDSCQRFREAARVREELLGEQIDWCLRRLPADVQADFDHLSASQSPRWDQ